VRLGGEFRFNKMYFRGGYGFYGKVFKPGELNEDMFNRSISFGTGFREQNLNIDFAFTNLRNEQNYILYNTNSETAMANLTNSRNIFTVTLGYKFGY
jgi:long-subunit fatty acid transport protein